MPTVAAGVGGLAHEAVGLGVVLMRAVAHVQPGDVHPGVHQLADPPRGDVAGPRVQTILASRTFQTLSVTLIVQKRRNPG